MSCHSPKAKPLAKKKKGLEIHLSNNLEGIYLNTSLVKDTCIVAIKKLNDSTFYYYQIINDSIGEVRRNGFFEIGKLFCASDTLYPKEIYNFISRANLPFFLIIDSCKLLYNLNDSISYVPITRFLHFNGIYTKISSTVKANYFDSIIKNIIFNYRISSVFVTYTKKDTIIRLYEYPDNQTKKTMFHVKENTNFITSINLSKNKSKTIIDDISGGVDEVISYSYCRFKIGNKKYYGWLKLDEYDDIFQYRYSQKYQLPITGTWHIEYMEPKIKFKEW